jgi:hypothetical protein
VTKGTDDKFARLFKIKPAKVKELYDAAPLAAELMNGDPGRYAMLLATLRKNKHKGLTDWDRHVKRVLADVRKRHKDAEAEARRAEAAQRGFAVDEDGHVLPTAENIRLAVEKLGVTLRYDEFRGSPAIEGLPDFGPWLDDPAMVRLWLTVEEQFGFRPRRDYFDAVIADSCQRSRFHPVREYLDGLTWDGKARIDTMLIDYAGAETNSYVRAIGAIVMIAAVRRVRRPGEKFDELLTLEGEQGLQKSTMLEALAVNEDWFSDSIPLNARDKEMIEGHAGKWIAEISDLQGMSKAEVERVKATLSRKVDRARLAYARLPIEVPRQCVFIGTTNGQKYLTDQTGNRRFWPVRVGRIDIEKLKADRDQLWAEAAVREAAGESIRLPVELWPEAVAEQSKRLVDNPFLDALDAVIRGRNGVLFVNDAYEVLGIAPKQRTQADAERLGEAMRVLGFEYVNRRKDGEQCRAWVRGGTEERRRFVVDRDVRTGMRRLWLKDADEATALAGDIDES